MNEVTKQMIDDETDALVEKLKAEDIGEEEFQRRMEELTDRFAAAARNSQDDSVHRERIRAAATLARRL